MTGKQMLHFFATGEIIDVCEDTQCDPCGKGPCVYPQPPGAPRR